jgi:hypothetical protein
MSQPPLLSIVVPTLDVSERLNDHIAAIAAHGAHNLELVVVCPSGSDTLRSSAREHGFASVQLIVGEDTSQPDGINHGARAAKGAALTWLNVGDRLAEGAVAAVAKALAAAPERAIIYGQAERVRAGGVTDHYPVATEISAAGLFQSCAVSQPAAWITRAAWTELGGLHAGYDCAFDYDLWIRAAHAGIPFIHLPVLLARVDIEPDAKTFRQRPQVFREHAELMMAHYGRCPPSVLTGLWSEALRPAEPFEGVAAHVLREAGTTLEAIDAAADRAGDEATRNRLRNDARLHFLQRGVAAEVSRTGWLGEASRLCVRTDRLPLNLLIAFDQPPDDPAEIALLDQANSRPVATMFYASTNCMVARIETEAAQREPVSHYTFLSAAPIGARLVDVW